MATTVEPRDGTQPYVDADEYIDFQLAKTQSQIKATEILTSASWLGLATLGYVLTFVVLDQWVMPGGFGAWTRAIWLGGLVLGGGTWLVTGILRPWFKTVHELYAAKAIESADPTLKSSLLNLVDLQIHNRKSQSALVRTSMEKRAAVELSRVDVDHAIDRQTLLRVAYGLLGMVVVCSLYVLLSPKDAFSSVQRLLLPSSQTAVATRTSIANLTPEDTRILAGELLTVEADILGQVPPQVTLLFTTADREFVDQPIEMQKAEEGISRYRGVISGEKGRGLMQNITYRLEAGDARTRDFNVEVLEPPTSQVESVHYEFPAYMKLEAKQRTGGHIDAWEGTKLRLTATTNLPVKSAMLVMTDTDNPLAKGEEVRMTITSGKQLTAEWPLEFRSDGTFARYYHIECTTPKGESDPQPKVYSIKIQPDQRPEVSLLHPTQDLERPANAVVPLLVKAADPDFLLRFVTLKVEKGGEELMTAALLGDEARPAFEGTYDLQLEKLGAAGLQPGDEILYWIEARDNKQPQGNRSTTPRLKIKITAPAKADELAKQLEEDREKQKEQAEEANSENNPLEPQPPQSDAAPEKEPRLSKPIEKKPEPRPGDPKTRKKDTENPEQPEQKPEDGANQPEQQPNKPEGEEKQGEKGQGQPQPRQKGQQGQEQRQPVGKQPDGKPEGDEGGEGEGQEEKSSKGQEGKSEGKTGQDKSRQQSGNGKQQDPSKKKADDEEALKKFLEKEQQQEPESNSEESGKESQAGDDPSDKSSDGEQKSSDKKAPGEQSPQNDKSKKPEPGSDGTQPQPDKSKPGQDKSQNQPGADKQGKEKSNAGGEQPKRGEGEKKPQASDGQDSPDNKPHADQKQGQTQSGKTPQPSENGTPQPGKEGSGDTKPEDRKPGQPGTNDKSMKKPGQGEDQDPNEKNEKKTDDGTPGESPKNPKDGNSDKQPGDVTNEKKDPKGAKPQANDKPGDGATAPGEDKPGGKKQPGPANKPTDEKGPEDNNAAEKGPGNGTKPKGDKKPGTEAEKNGEKSSPEMKGEETPAEDGPDAQKRQADGTETGKGVGQEKPEGEAPQAQNKLDRKPESKPGAMRDSEKPRDPNVKPEEGSKTAKTTKTKSDGSARPDDPMKGAGKEPGQPEEKRPGSEPSQDDQNPGKGSPKQKSQKPDSGEEGGGTPQDKGTPGSKQKGQGDTENKPGDQTPDMKKEGGKPGEKAGEGSKSKPAQDGTAEKKPGQGGEPSSDKPDGESKDSPMPGEGKSDEGKPGEGKPGDGKPGEGKPGESGKGEPKPGANQPGQPGEGKPGTGKPGKGKSGGQPGQSGATPGEGGNSDDQTGNEPGNGQPGKPDPERRNLPPADQEQADLEAAEKANEEFARKASNLVLKKLRKDLDRGEVDQKMLDELGWKKEDMERFVQRLENQLADPGDDQSPESIASRRQFEETLKSLGLSSKTRLRKAVGGKPTRVNELGDRKIAPPPEYQELFEEYTKDLAKPTTKSR